jgi:hypothetical protein
MDEVAWLDTAYFRPSPENLGDGIACVSSNLEFSTLINILVDDALSSR